MFFLGTTKSNKDSFELVNKQCMMGKNPHSFNLVHKPEEKGELLLLIIVESRVENLLNGEQRWLCMNLNHADGTVSIVYSR